MGFTIYSQRDLRWASRKIGQSDLTIGRWGCCLSSICMIGSYFGEEITPLQFAANANNFNKEGLVTWSNLKFNKMKFDRRSYLAGDSDIKRAISDPDRAVILQVNDGQHWLVAIRATFWGNDFVCADPFTGKKCLSKRDYHNISGCAFFSRKTV